MMNIEYVEWGLANTYGETIEMHKDLIKYPALHSFILNHEQKHGIKETVSQQFVTDVSDSFTPMHLHVYAFMLFRPKTWIQFLPIYIHKKYGVVYDLTAILIYSVMACFSAAIYYIWITI